MATTSIVLQQTTSSIVLSLTTATMPDASAVPLAQKDAASGVPGLDANIRMKAGELPGPGIAGARSASLATFRAAWANRASAPVNIVAVGDSVTVGYYSTSYTNRWFDKMIARLCTATGQTKALGYVPTTTTSAGGYTNAVWATTGTVTDRADSGLGYNAVSVAQGGTISIVATCDSFSIHYPDGALRGAFTVATSDGGTLATVTPNTGGATVGGRVWHSGTIASQSRTITITPTSAFGCIIEGGTFYIGNGPTASGAIATTQYQVGTGVRGFMGGHFGYKASGNFDTIGASTWWTDGLDYLDPHLVLVYLGINDQGAAVGASTYQTALGTIIAKIQSVADANSQTRPSIVVVVPYGTGTGSTDSNAYQQAARAAALAASVAYVDWSDLFGYVGTAAVDTAPAGNSVMSSADGSTAKKHPNDKGHKWLGEWMASYLLAATGDPGSSGGGGGTVTSVTGTAPIVSSGGTTPAISVTTGTTTGTVAAGDDSRITGAAQKASNLSDLASASTSRTNLGLGGAAVLSVGTTAGTVAAGDDARLSDTRTPSALSVTSAKMAGWTVNAQVGTTYTYVPGDAFKIVTHSNGSAITATIDTDANQAIPVGAEIIVTGLGAGLLTIAAAGGVTINNPTGASLTLARYQVARLVHTAANTWQVNKGSRPPDGTTLVVNASGQLAFAPTADVAIGSHKLTGVTDPTSAQDAATKNYADNIGARCFIPTLYPKVTSGTAWTNAAGGGFVPTGRLDYNGAGAVNDSAYWDLGLMPAGTYAFDVCHFAGADRAIATIETSPDAGAWTAFTTVDMYGGSVQVVVEVTGLVVAAPFRYLRFKAASKNASSSNYVMALSCFSLRRTA